MIAANDSNTVAAGSVLNVPAPGVLANDSQGEAGPATLTATIVTTPTHGTVMLNGDRSFTYSLKGAFTVVDGCGEWPTFVGGGTGAGF